MEKIISIKEVQNVPPDVKRSWDTCDGYEIVTNNQTIKLLISNGQSCCEEWGYFLSDDILTEYIGAELIGISLVDDQFMTKAVPKKLSSEEDGYGGGTFVMFVNLETSKGLLQFAAYNSHNGFYGHDAYIISEQVTEQNIL